MPKPIIPFALEEERHLLGVLLRDQSKLPEGLHALHFYEPKNYDVASAIETIVEEGGIPDELSVFNKLVSWNSTVEAFYLAQLTAAVGYSRLNPLWVQAIIRTYKFRAILAAIESVKAEIANPLADPSNVQEHLIEAARELDLKEINASGSSPQMMDLDALMEFDRKNDPNSILGNRWLCKGGSLLIVGQSGTGKSSLMMQAAVRWAVGREFFGINPVEPLRSIILQAENDLGDVAESLISVKEGACLSSQEEQTLRNNFAIYRDTISVGKAFARVLKDLITKHRAQIVYVDPLLSFAGINVSDQEQVSKFLRHDIAPILLETGCVLVAMHHTGKPIKASEKEGQTIADLAYAGLGSSEFTNYFREVAVLLRCQGESPIYKFGLTKRRGRSNMKNLHGEFAPEILIRHSKTPGVIRWEYAEPDAQPSPTQNRQPPPPKRPTYS